MTSALILLCIYIMLNQTLYCLVVKETGWGRHNMTAGESVIEFIALSTITWLAYIWETR